MRSITRELKRLLHGHALFDQYFGDESGFR
jgi:hypothetical protein